MNDATDTDRQDGTCPPWCDSARCDNGGPGGGAHIGSTPPLVSSSDDIEIRVDRAEWPAEKGYDAEPQVLLDLRSTAFVNEEIRGFLTPADAREVARRLVEAADIADAAGAHRG